MPSTESQKTKYFHLHNLNKKSLENAIALIKSNIKEQYRRKDFCANYIFRKKFNSSDRVSLINDIRSYERILFGLIVSWSEECIKRLLYEPNLFSEVQIDYVIGKSLEQKWSLAFKLSFCIANNIVPVGNEACQGLTIHARHYPALASQIDKYNEIRMLITDLLVPSFNIRNKVQHGEWIAAFKPPDSKVFDRCLTQKIFKENIVTLNARIIIFNSIYQMIVDLARFKSNNFKIDPATTPFEHFYKQHKAKVEQQVSLLASPRVHHYISDLIDKDARGMEYRQRANR